MTFLSKAIASLLVAGSLFVTGLFWDKVTTPPTPTAPAISFGAINNFFPAMIPQTTLSGAGVTSSQNTIPVTAFTTADGRAVTMAMLGTIGYGTLEPNTTAKEEIISFTGITQNANGTAILTGVTRGLDFVTPYASTASLMKQHAGGAYFIISNSAPFYGQQFLLANTLSTSTAGIVFSSTTPPYYDFNPTFASFSSTTLASKGYVDAGLAAGGVPGNSTTAGLFMFATALQAGSSTGTGVFNAVTYNRALGSAYATDTPQNCSTPANGGCVVLADLTGHIKQAWLDFTATWTFTGPVSIIASAANKLTLDGLAYVFPTLRSASTTVLSEDGAGNLTWEYQHDHVLFSSGNLATSTTVSATSTLFTVTVPANTISTTSQMMRITGTFYNPSSGAGNCFYQIAYGNGGGVSTSTLGYASQGSTGSPTGAQIIATLYATSTSSLYGAGQGFGMNTTGGVGNFNSFFSYSNASITATSYIAFQAKETDSATQACGVKGATVEIVNQ